MADHVVGRRASLESKGYEFRGYERKDGRLCEVYVKREVVARDMLSVRLEARANSPFDLEDEFYHENE